MSALVGWIESRERFEDGSTPVIRTEIKAGNFRDFIKAIKRVVAQESYIDFVHRWVLYSEMLGGYQTIWRTDIEIGKCYGKPYRGLWAYSNHLDKHYKAPKKGRKTDPKGPRFSQPYDEDEREMMLAMRDGRTVYGQKMKEKVNAK